MQRKKNACENAQKAKLFGMPKTFGFRARKENKFKQQNPIRKNTNSTE